ncbi:Essential protein Yae1, N terminal [Saxophila tyrrhenica]|uniref:Protein YAE1 n=1 Tax=Saxophila tyrrhenica TaxID=1690608 RepID=A0AAV9NYN0_9PEZI|nr:Essential protein Yae1, N terminal [Saxophila tyrrhenica]
MLRDLPSPYNSHDTTLFMTVPGAHDGHHEPNIAADHVDPLDDVFGSAPASPTVPAAPRRSNSETTPTHPAISQHPSDVPRLRQTHVTNGYREGVAESKEIYLQQGFDEGYAVGAELGLKAGWLLGALDGLLRAVLRSDGEGREDRGAVSNRLQEVQNIVQQAEGELRIEQLCSSEWFGEDGVWLFEVPQKNAADDVTFAEVSDAHPVISRWRTTVREVGGSTGLQLS